MPLYKASEVFGDTVYEFEDILSIEEYEKHPYLISPISGRECPIIPNVKLNFKISNKSGGIPKNTGYVIDASPKTLGGLADYNTKKLGSDYIKEMELKEKERKKQKKIEDLNKYKLPQGCKVNFEAFDSNGKSEVPWRDSKFPDMSLAKMNAEETAKYILDGKKPIGLSQRNKNA